MGSGEIVGNQSVYWRMVHEDPKGNKRAMSGSTPHAAKGGKPTPVPDTVLISDEAFGHDGIAFGEIGTKHGKTGSFKLTVRFPDNAIATAELAKALQSIGNGNEATVYVPAINRPAGNANPAIPPAEIQIDW